MTKRKMKRSSRVYEIKRANTIITAMKALVIKKKDLKMEMIIMISVNH